jgi:hypothetical protein
LKKKLYLLKMDNLENFFTCSFLPFSSPEVPKAKASIKTVHSNVKEQRLGGV